MGPCLADRACAREGLAGRRSRLVGRARRRGESLRDPAEPRVPRGLSPRHGRRHHRRPRSHRPPLEQLPGEGPHRPRGVNVYLVDSGKLPERPVLVATTDLKSQVGDIMMATALIRTRGLDTYRALSLSSPRYVLRTTECDNRESQFTARGIRVPSVRRHVVRNSLSYVQTLERRSMPDTTAKYPSAKSGSCSA
jgi:hypothetical protein